MTTLKKLAGLIVLAAFFATGLNAQTRNEAIEAYNQGVGLMKTDVQGAINSFEKSIQISEQVGDSAIDMRDKAAAVLPDLYYQLAYNFYTQKNVPQSLVASKNAIQVAEKYNNELVKDRAVTLATQLYTVQGNNYFKANQNEQALAAFDSALKVNPENTKLYLNKALVYRKMDNAALFSENIDKYILNPGKNDTATLSQARKIAVDFYRLAGAKANQANKQQEALDLLNKAIQYGEDKNVYYHLANIYNKQKKFDEAALNAQKGLDMETGSATDKAKFYYELAVAQAGKGDKENACSNFKNASYGSFVTAAKGQMTNLKCGGAAPAAK